MQAACAKFGIDSLDTAVCVRLVLAGVLHGIEGKAKNLESPYSD